MRLRVFSYAYAVVLATRCDGQPLGFSKEGSLNFFRASDALTKLALDAETEAEDWRTNRTKLPRKPYPKGCWQQPNSACRRLATHPEFLAAAKTMTGDKDLFIVATNPVRKIIGDRQDLHTDLDLWAPECANNNSASVWVLLEFDSDSRSPVLFIDGSDKTGVMAQDIREEMGCRVQGGWYNIADRPDDAEECRAEKVLEVARAKFPEIDLKIVTGPIEPNVGVAWSGHSWHETMDDGNRLAALVQYGTEECARAVRRPRHWDVSRRLPPWRSDDWFAWMPAEKRNLLKTPTPFDTFTMGPLGGDERDKKDADDRKEELIREEAEIGAGSRRRIESSSGLKTVLEMDTGKCMPSLVDPITDVYKSHVVPKNILRKRSVPFKASPEIHRSGEDPREMAERSWQNSIASPHSHFFVAHVAQYQSNGEISLVHENHVHTYDELRIVLEGKVSYSVGYDGTCGMYSVFDAFPGQVNFFPSRLAHSVRSSEINSAELVIHFAPKSRDVTKSIDLTTDTLGHPSRRYLTVIGTVADKLRFVLRNEASFLTNGTKPDRGKTHVATLFSLVGQLARTLPEDLREDRIKALDDLGYQLLRSKIISFGASVTMPSSSHYYDVLVVALSDRAKLLGPKGGEVIILEKLDYAIVPSGREFGIQAFESSSVDVLIIEFSAGGERRQRKFQSDDRSGLSPGAIASAAAAAVAALS